MRRLFTIALAFGAGSSCTQGLPPDDYAGIMALASQVATTGNIIVTSVAGSVYETSSTSPTAGFYVSLRTQPAADVVIGPVLASNTSELAMVDPSTGATVGSRMLTFTSSNYSTPQLIAFRGYQDFVVDGDKTISISFGSITTQDTVYARETIAAVSVVNSDRDKYLYVTTPAYVGNFGAPNGLTGIAAADYVCNNNVNKPTSPADATYKAVIADATTSTVCNGAPCRRATVTANTGDGQIDWALKPLHIYYRAPPAAAAFVVITNAQGLFIFGAGAPAACGAMTMLGSPVAAGPDYWTGLQCDWTGRPPANSCNGWTDNTVGFGGNFGTATSSGQTSIQAAGNYFCNTSHALLCAQQ